MTAVRVTSKGLMVEWQRAAPAVRVTAKGLMIEWAWARTALAPQLIQPEGLEPVFAAVNPAGFAMSNIYGERTFLVVRNGGAASMIVTARIPYKVDGLSVAPRTVTVPAGEERWIGNLPGPYYNQAGEVVWFDFSAVTNVTAAAVRVAARDF